MTMTANAADFSQNAGESGAWRRVGVFYLLATVLSGAIWIVYGAQIAGILAGRLPASLVVASQYSPSVAALILIGREGGFAGLARFLRRSLNFRIGLRWYAIALLTPPMIGLGLIVLHAAQGGYVPPLAAWHGLHDNVAKFLLNIHDVSGGAAGSSGIIQTLAGWASNGAIQAVLTLFAIAFANGGISEEAGWRGYALATLLPGRNVLTVALTVGFFWGLWHTGPAFWAGVFQSSWRVFAIPFGYTLGTIPLTVMIAWVFIKSGKSLVPGMLFHAGYNSTYFLLTQIWTPGRPVVSLGEWLVGTYLAALIVVIAGRRTFFAPGQADC